MNKEVKHTHTRLISKVLMKKTPLFEMAQEPPPSVTVLLSNKNDHTRVYFKSQLCGVSSS